MTLKDIAKMAGVTHPTVSRALRNHPRIGVATRLRIQKFAREMGYRPDPTLGALAAYRNTKRPKNRYEKIAVLCHLAEGKAKAPYLADSIMGIQSRANERGFDAEVFHIEPGARSQQQLSRILYHRGIRGLVVTPLLWEPKAFDWSKFVVVGIGENAMPLLLNYVSYDHDAAIRETYTQLRFRGYKNIGFLNEYESEKRNRFLFVSAFLKCRLLDECQPVDPFLYKTKKESALPWLRKHRFDAVITHYALTKRWDDTPFRVPERLGAAGFATHEKGPSQPGFASYVIDGARLGITAVDFLETLLQRNQMGIPDPENQYSMIIRGYWRDGPSVRPPVRFLRTGVHNHPIEGGGGVED